VIALNGGSERVRTADPLLAKQIQAVLENADFLLALSAFRSIACGENLNFNEDYCGGLFSQLQNHPHVDVELNPLFQCLVGTRSNIEQATCTNESLINAVARNILQATHRALARTSRSGTRCLRQFANC
jgi:hypothetical protein